MKSKPISIKKDILQSLCKRKRSWKVCPWMNRISNYFNRYITFSRHLFQFCSVVVWIQSLFDFRIYQPAVHSAVSFPDIFLQSGSRKDICYPGSYHYGSISNPPSFWKIFKDQKIYDRSYHWCGHAKYFCMTEKTALLNAFSLKCNKALQRYRKISLDLFKKMWFYSRQWIYHFDSS